VIGVTSAVSVRPVRVDEHERVARLTLAAYDALGVPRGRYRAALADVAGRAAHAPVLVGVRGTDVVGAVTYVPDRDNRYAEFDDPDAAGIRMLAVDPVAQRTGAGGALVAACVDRAAAAGRARIVLHTTDEMVAARRLYERMGFRRTPDRDWRPEPHIALLGYVLDLDVRPSRAGA
jgi:ribosomal protein S18 acetylase RimI-like enzyme